MIGRSGAPRRSRRRARHIYGYTVANDVSARDVQFADGQWVRGKSLDTFCPLGPVVVTADEIADPQALRCARASTARRCRTPRRAEMVFGVAYLIAFLSRSFTLEPRRRGADRHAVGLRRVHGPEALASAGDVVEVEIERIGTLRNPVVEA